MLEIPLIHGTIWINPYHVVAIEKSDEGSFVVMDNGGWNSPLPPDKIAFMVAAVTDGRLRSLKAS